MFPPCKKVEICKTISPARRYEITKTLHLKKNKQENKNRNSIQTYQIYPPWRGVEISRRKTLKHLSPLLVYHHIHQQGLGCAEFLWVTRLQASPWRQGRRLSTISRHLLYWRWSHPWTMPAIVQCPPEYQVGEAWSEHWRRRPPSVAREQGTGHWATMHDLRDSIIDFRVK